MQDASEKPKSFKKSYKPYGAAAELHRRKDKEILISGPAGTGKSRATLEKLDDILLAYPGARGLIVRKTLLSLKGSGLVTFDEKVKPHTRGVIFKGDTARRPAHYQYPNGSVAVIGGLDKSSKIMSTEYDIICVLEATEFEETDWLSLTTRLRNNVAPFQQILGDCNPSSSQHWLKKRCDEGKTVLLESRHEDNPELYDRVKKRWTPNGREYIATLDALTGVLYLRLRKGLWAAAEGMVYEDVWDSARLLKDHFDPPDDWDRFWVIDFGYTNPFCWQAWARDTDGRLYRYKEIYFTQRLVEDHARDIMRVSLGDKRPRAIIVDHDAEDRATFEAHHIYCATCDAALTNQEVDLHDDHDLTDFDLTTTAAHKAISPGIQAVASRMKVAGDGKSRIFFLRDSLVERDPKLVAKKKPTRTEEEVDGYIWNTSGGRRKGEEPIKENDHGLDNTRYVVAHIDIEGATEAALSSQDPKGDTPRERVRNQRRESMSQPTARRPRWRSR